MTGLVFPCPSVPSAKKDGDREMLRVRLLSELLLRALADEATSSSPFSSGHPTRLPHTIQHRRQKGKLSSKCPPGQGQGATRGCCSDARSVLRDRLPAQPWPPSLHCPGPPASFMPQYAPILTAARVSPLSSCHILSPPSSGWVTAACDLSRAHTSLSPRSSPSSAPATLPAPQAPPVLALRHLPFLPSRTFFSQTSPGPGPHLVSTSVPTRLSRQGLAWPRSCWLSPCPALVSAQPLWSLSSSCGPVSVFGAACLSLPKRQLLEEMDLAHCAHHRVLWIQTVPST